jgi:hypothetical protein
MATQWLMTAKPNDSKAFGRMHRRNRKEKAPVNPTTTLITLSFRRKPESSYNDTKDGNFGSMDIGGLLDAGSSPA